jgi:hypothetical protein
MVPKVKRFREWLLASFRLVEDGAVAVANA